VNTAAGTSPDRSTTTEPGTGSWFEDGQARDLANGTTGDSHADVDFAALAAAKEPVLVLFRDVADLARAAAAGLTPALAPRVNIGNVHYAAGRRAVTPSVFLTREEVADLEALSRAGFDVEARAIPADSPVGVKEIAEKYDEGAARS
jgi:hypothetical protein